MILYNVTISVEGQIEKEWLKWMREIHIPDVMATKLFVDHKIFKLMNEVDGGTTYAIQYFALDEHDMNTYMREHAPRLQKEHTDRYQNRAIAFRTLLQQVV